MFHTMAKSGLRNLSHLKRKSQPAQNNPIGNRLDQSPTDPIETARKREIPKTASKNT